MNRFEFIGNLVKDIELKTTSTNISVCKFNIAVTRKFKNNEGERDADFFNIVAWRSLADNLAKYCKKGSKIYVSGEIQNRSYEDDDGTKKYVTEFIANECEFLNTKQTDGNSSQEPTGASQVDDDSLPF